jgi:hypothetical protein
MATINIGGGGNNNDFIMVRNSITAPLHTTMQVVCSMIPFCIICGSHSSVDELSSLLVYYTELIGKKLLMFQTSMLPLFKGVSVQVMNLRYSSTHSQLHYHR